MPRPDAPKELRQPLADTITEDREGAPSDRAVAAEAVKIYPDTNPGRPTPEEIAAEAYKIYLGRGAGHGGDLDDWLEAERRLAKPRT